MSTHLRERIAATLAAHDLPDNTDRDGQWAADALMPLIAAEIGRLEAEIDRADLRTQNKQIRALEAELAVLQAAGIDPDDTKLTGISGEPGHTTVSLRPPELLMRAFIASMIDMLGDATNYVEMEASNPDGLGRYLVRVQRAGGESPHALRQEAENRARALEKENNRLQALADAATERDRIRAAIQAEIDDHDPDHTFRDLAASSQPGQGDPGHAGNSWWRAYVHVGGLLHALACLEPSPADAAAELTRHDQEHGMYEEGK